MEVLEIMATGLLCLACFITGAKLGQKVTKGEEIKVIPVNPVQAVREHKETKEADEKAKMVQFKMETILQNIDKYDGTTKGQEDVP